MTSGYKERSLTTSFTFRFNLDELHCRQARPIAMNATIFIIFSAGFLVSFFCEATAASVHGEEICHRQPKYSVIGRNMSTQRDITFDVGECTRGDDWTSNQAITKPSSDCVPHTIAEERVLLYNTFILEMEKVLTCQKVPSTCQRLPRMVTYYPGTVYGRTVDVGACGGLCRDEKACMPTKTRTAAISTPNGKRSIEIIVGCTCVTPFCYRVSAFEAFPEEHTDVRGEKVIRTKHIDMGRCVGNNRCPKLRPSTPQDIFVSPETKCSINTTKMQSYVAIGGRQVQVATVDTCSCH